MAAEEKCVADVVSLKEHNERAKEARALWFKCDEQARWAGVLCDLCGAMMTVNHNQSNFVPAIRHPELFLNITCPKCGYVGLKQVQ